MTLTEAKAEITRIDRAINANRDELFRRAGIRPKTSFAAWQAAWSLHPDLHAVELDLFRQRGDMQKVRDSLAA